MLHLQGVWEVQLFPFQAFIFWQGSVFMFRSALDALGTSERSAGVWSSRR